MSPPPEAQLAQLITGKWIAQAVSTAAALELPDRFAAGPRTPEEVAAEAGLHPGATARLLRALAGLGLFEGAGEGRYALTPMGDLLRREREGSMWAMARMESLPEFWRPWGQLAESVRDGGSAFRRVYGRSFFEHLRDHQEAARVFDAAMSGISEGDARALAGAYDFARHEVIADVGGGHGRLLAAALEAAPGSRGWLCDLGDVVGSAGPYLESRGMTGRVELHEIDFFQGVPAGADAYLLKHIIHDWGDEACRTILGHCREGLAEGGRVLVAESPLPEGDDPHVAKWLDLQMLVMTEGGRERTLEEYRELLASAGLELVEAHPAGPTSCLLEARAG